MQKSTLPQSTPDLHNLKHNPLKKLNCIDIRSQGEYERRKNLIKEIRSKLNYSKERMGGEIGSQKPVTNPSLLPSACTSA